MEEYVLPLYEHKTVEVFSKNMPIYLYCRSVQTFSRTSHIRTRPYNSRPLMFRVLVGVASVIMVSWIP